MQKVIIFLMFSCVMFANAQTNLTTINQNSFDNYANTYNYTFWDNNWKTSGASRSFSMQTSSYALNIDYSNLNINSLVVGESLPTKKEAFEAEHSAIFPVNYDGNLDYAILQNGSILHEKSNNPTSFGAKDAQMAEYGMWHNTRFVSTNFTNSADVSKYFTGVEFTNWHNRLKVGFHVRSNVEITNGQLQFTFEMPTEYTQYYNNGDTYAFALPNNKGFALKAGNNVETIKINGNLITITSAQQNLLANESYEISLLFKALTNDVSSSFINAFDDETPLTIAVNQTIPNNSDLTNNVAYNENNGIHYINIPRVNMGYNNCGLIDKLQHINFDITNNNNQEKRMRLCFRRQPNINVTGFNSLICNDSGEPSGLPLQVSKNWHTTTEQLYSGSWIREYTELIVPANTTMNLSYRSTGAKWGETYNASSHQLSVVGAGIPRGGWLEAALGTFGENITHSPDYEYGSSNGCDFRPFLVTNQGYGGTSSECSWTGNVGGLDMFVYRNDNNQKIYQSQVKTDFKRYSPNLTETSISAISADGKLKLDYTFYLNRSDDFTRVYYKVKVKALENTDFNRFDLFQLGGDVYNIHTAQNIIYGDENGMYGQFLPTNDGSNDYTTAPIALTGDNPWIWSGDGLYYDGTDNSGININTNNGLIIRDYSATFNGVENNTPYFRERSASGGFSASKGTNPTSYCIVPPPTVTNFTAGDEMEVLAEVVIFPKDDFAYYGNNQNFTNALTTYGNSYEMLLREVQGNNIIASSPDDNVNENYPLSVETNNNTAKVKVSSGKGYIPLVFEGLTAVDNPTLWKANNDCWELVNQSNYGKDFWQTDYNYETNTFDLIYNINQDTPDDTNQPIWYYLGSEPPDINIVVQTQIVGESWSINNELGVVVGENDVRLAPQITQFSATSVGTNNNWQWQGPNGNTHTGRVWDIYPVNTNNLGAYTVIYTDEFGCTDTQSHTIYADSDGDTIADNEDECVYDPLNDWDNDGNCAVNVQLKLFLEGAFDETTAEMRSELMNNNLLPKTQPYAVAPYNYMGTESIINFPSTEIVDWILIEARETSDLYTTAEAKACFLLKDGTTIDINGREGVNFHTLDSNQNYRFVVYHKGHLGVMTSANINVSTAVNYDFTNSVYKANGIEQLKEKTGVYMLHSGDFDNSGVINNLDYNKWQVNASTVSEYLHWDVDLNGVSNNVDFNFWRNNRSKIGTTHIVK